ncbi:extracellular solute-binding protein [Candidatus Poribacteria bacterium]|nr:extracellular solute-binding protein [Candidatus Poribacteria bacterium]
MTSMKTLVSSITLICCFVVVGFSLAEDSLVIISPHPEGIESEFDRTFKPWYKRETGRAVNVEWIDRGGTSSDFRFIESEFQRVPEGIGLDLFFGGGTDYYLKLVEKGLLQPYKLPEALLKRIPQDIYGIPVYDSEYRWYGAALSTFGIMYNEELRQRLGLPEVSTWNDLTHPEVFRWVGAADPRESGSAHMMYEIILQGYGWEKGLELITKLGANVRGFSAGSSAIPRDVALGQVIYGMAIDFYAYGKIIEVGEDRVKYILPSDAVVVSPDSIAILKGAPNLKVAQKFLEFVFSDEAQKLWVLKDTDPEGPKWKGGLNRRSVIPALYDELGDRCVVPNPFKMDMKPIHYDSEKAGTRWNIVNDIIGALVIDSHKDLVNAWKAIKKCKKAEKREAAIQALVRLPITEEEAMQIAQEDWKRQDFRNQKLKEWGQFATQKFKEAKKLAK